MTNTSNIPFDYLIISPHPDDAVFSLGQHIINWLKLGKNVKIINVFNSYGAEDLSSENAWNVLLKYGYQNVKELTQARAADNQRVYEKLAITQLSLNYIDASFRHFSNIPVYATAQSLTTGRPSTYDSDLPAHIIQEISTESYQTILCPYGVGGHVDHAILRNVGNILKKQKHNVQFYLESPYLWRDLNYLKLSFQILRASSYLNQVADKMAILKLYSYHDILVRPHEKFPEVIL